MSRFNTIDHEVRRLVATSTTNTLIRYVQEQTLESYRRGYFDGWKERDRVRVRTLLWRSLRRALRRLVRRLIRRLI